MLNIIKPARSFLIISLKNSKTKTFNQGFMTTELLAAAILDMNLHNLTDTENIDVVAYEKKQWTSLV